MKTKKRNVKTCWVARPTLNMNSYDKGSLQFTDYQPEDGRHAEAQVDHPKRIVRFLTDDVSWKLFGLALKPGCNPVEVRIERVVRAKGKFAKRPARKARRK